MAERLASFKVPQRVVFLDRMPLGGSGKVDRLVLAELAAAEESAAAAAGPASDLEARVAAVWAAELGLQSVGPGKNFFAIGGDSLSGVRMFLAVEKAFGKPLPDSSLVSITTVREMARLIEAGATGPPGPELEGMAGDNEGELTETEKRVIAVVMGLGGVPVARPGSAIKAINPGGSRRPLFWCCNSPGKDIVGLAPHLDPEQPFYAIFSGGRMFPRTAGMAAKIARFSAGEIVALQPEGPYFLGGDCHGGRVAAAIAKVLAERGHEVRKLCLLEYASPDLHEFDGELLLLFGKQSRLMAYREIGFGEADWSAPFRHPPQVAWVGGPHGRYFYSYYVSALMRTLDRFLQDRPQRPGRLAGLELGLIMAIHRVPLLFAAYIKAFRLAERVFHGKRAKLDRFTGEPIVSRRRQSGAGQVEGAGEPTVNAPG